MTDKNNFNKDKTSIIFTGDIGFDKYMTKKWEGSHMYLAFIAPLAEKAENGEWQKSKHEKVKNYLLKQITEG